MAAYTTWHKSSFSGGNGGDCVEVVWRKSSSSHGNGGDCVEVANSLWALRDSKNPAGPVLTGRVDVLIAALKVAPAFGSRTLHG
jgi:hypothetical protein